ASRDEGHGVVRDLAEPLVRDPDAVRVAAEIPVDVLGASEWLLRVDDPVVVVKALFQALELVGRGGAEPALLQEASEPGHELPAEEEREHPHREEVATLAVGADPLIAVGRETAARDDAVDVRMQLELTRPGVKDRRDPEL